MCMSIVASAFQYGWAPTLMPVTTTLISPPSWVNSMIPRSTREIQSMVSLPESIAIFAPDGDGEPLHRGVEPPRQLDRREHPPALRLGDRAQCLGRVAEQHDPAHALRVARGGRADHPEHQVGRVPAGRPVDRHRRPVLVEVVLGERARSAVAVGRAGDQRDELVGVDRAAAAGPDHLLRIGVQLAQRMRRRFGDPQRQPGARRAGHPQHPLAGLGVRVAGIGSPELHQHLLQAERLGAGGE